MTRIIDGPAGQLNLDDGGGGGMPALFVHSFAASAAHWQPQLAHVRRHRRAVALDLRGHGDSDAPTDADYSVPALAQDIAAVADALELRRFVLVGHGLGGAAAAAYVAANTGRVAGLVLVSTPGKAPQGQAMDGYWGSLMEGAKPGVRERRENEMHAMGQEPSAVMMKSLLAFDPLPALHGYKGSLLIIDTDHGDHPAALYRQLPEATRKVLPGTSHWPHLDKPQEFNRLLDDFLAWIA